MAAVESLQLLRHALPGAIQYPGPLPPSADLLLLPLPWSLPAFCLFHVFLAGLGMYFLARRWTGSQAGAALAGVVFLFNGLTLNFLMWPSHIATFAWLPWVVLLAEDGWNSGGRKIIAAALAAAMEILAGGPETILFTGLLVLTLAAAACLREPGTIWRTARRLAAMGLLALGLSAAQMLPFADFALHGSRGIHYGNSAWAMPLWGWGNFLVPLFQTSQWQQIAVQRDQYWTSSYYAGIGVVFLAGIALWRGRRNWRVWLAGGIPAGEPRAGAGRQGLCSRVAPAAAAVPGVLPLPGKVCHLDRGDAAAAGGLGCGAV